MDIEKNIKELSDRLSYIKDIVAGGDNDNLRILEGKFREFLDREPGLSTPERQRQFTQLEDMFIFLEKKLDAELSPMDKVRIVRHPQRITLKDILENVYDNYTEIGGQDEYSIDPAMLIARAYISRKRGDKVVNQPVMVIGQEKGHGEEFRNGGSVKPWGNAKALQYMKVAETENIPIHAYVFTPGAYPIEDYPGAAQQIARNLYEMSGLRVPIVACFSEGGSGGAEAIGLADTRLMLSHGYYSVISPEGAAAIESGIRQGQRAPAELIEKCAFDLKITSADNLRMGFVDRVIQEPPLGARPEHYEFFKTLRAEMIRATDEIVLQVRGVKLLRAMALSRREGQAPDVDNMQVFWGLTPAQAERLIWRRYRKFRDMSKNAMLDNSSAAGRFFSQASGLGWSVFSYFRHDFLLPLRKSVWRAVEDAQAELQLLKRKAISEPLRRVRDKLIPHSIDPEKQQKLTELSCPEEGVCLTDNGWNYLSPQAREDRAVTCTNAATHGCMDMWAPDLFGDFAGVCGHCGHHFPMEYQWYLYNVFDPDSIMEFNSKIESTNPLSFPGFDEKLAQAKKKTGKKCACMTFEARIKGLKLVVAMLMAPFRGGTVGAAEGEKFIRAAAWARRRRLPFLAYVHGTAGIRINEGVNGVIQMPRCTMAVRRYIEAGGLYLVLYDTNSYAGPVASFLGCSPYQFSVRSANIGFAGPGVIKETTGIDIPPFYHRSYHALARGHIQGIWDRREVRKNLYQTLLTMGGGNLYYR